MVLDDQSIQMWQIAQALRIGRERVVKILYNYLNIKRVSVQQVSKMLTLLDKQRRLANSKHSLNIFKDKLNEKLFIILLNLAQSCDCGWKVDQA